MIQVAIVEDDEKERNRILECLSFLEETENIKFLAKEFSTGEAFIGNFQNDFDIVFMDIQLPGMDGMETAKALRRMDEAVVLIFVTNMAQYAISGYEVEALDFILKPINKYSFALKVKRAVARCYKKEDDYISIKEAGETKSVRIASIKYLDLMRHHVIYHTLEGNISEYITLKEAAEKIGKDYFVYCNRSYLVNLRHVNSVNKETVTVGDEKLLISRPQRKAFLTALSDYMRGKKG